MDSFGLWDLSLSLSTKQHVLVVGGLGVKGKPQSFTQLVIIQSVNRSGGGKKTHVCVCVLNDTHKIQFQPKNAVSS